MTASRPLILLHLAGLAVLAGFPWVGGEFYVDLVLKLMILALFALSLDLLVGYTGLVSLGHAAFFGLAGYVLAMVTPEAAPANLWLAVACCLAASAAAALAIGWFSVRTSGIYFIMITLGVRPDALLLLQRKQRLRGIGRAVRGVPAGGGRRLAGVVRPRQRHDLLLLRARHPDRRLRGAGHHPAGAVRRGAARHPRQRASHPGARLPHRAVTSS